MTTLATETSRRYGIDPAAAARLVDLARDAVRDHDSLAAVAVRVDREQLVTTDDVRAGDVVSWLTTRLEHTERTAPPC